MSPAERDFYANRALFGMDGGMSLFHHCDCPRLAHLLEHPTVFMAARAADRRAVVAAGVSLLAGLFGVSV